MPQIPNIPPLVRFVLYLVGAVGSIAVKYLSDQKLIGAHEVTAWTSLVGLLLLLSAAHVSTQSTQKETPRR